MNILVDCCVFTQTNQAEGVNFWQEAIPALVTKLQGHQIYCLNRTDRVAFPQIEAIKNLFAPPVDFSISATEDRRLAALCRDLNIDVFISTYNTSAGIDVNSLFVVWESDYTAIEQEYLIWSSRQRAVRMATGYLAIFENAVNHLQAICDIAESNIRVVASTADIEEIAQQSAIAIQELFNYQPTPEIRTRRITEEEVVEEQATYLRRLATIKSCNPKFYQQEDLGLYLIASISEINVKQRVYNNISKLTRDHWLESDLDNYQKSISNKDTSFDSISFLNWYAHNFKPQNYFEVGVRRGRSMSQVLVESSNTKAYGFDMWIPEYASLPRQGIHTTNPGPDFVLAELRKLGVSNLPELIVGDSHETLPAFFGNPDNPQKFDLIFIDGDHTYLGAKMDLDMAFAHLADGGALVFDDITHHAHPELLVLWNEYKTKFSNYVFIEDSSGTGTGIAFKPPFTELLKLVETSLDSIGLQHVLALKDQLPIHFFTIVLNGEPFIRYHIDIFKQLPFKWHWHIVEGVAELKHDTAWSVQLGGKITDDFHHKGCSNDGTTEYLNELVQLYPDNITIYRKSEGVFWEGKREMVNAPLANIQEECLLWQVDADELWTLEQICTARKMFIENPEKTAALYWCWYFVGEDLVISTRNCYAENPQQDWQRTWRYKPGLIWAAHEPPVLVETLPDGQQRNVARINPFLHDETEKKGLVFQHFAYVTLNQLKFKEQYYGYKDAVAKWSGLQTQFKYPVLLREHFPWVQDGTMVDTSESLGILPIAQREPISSPNSSSNWRFLRTEELPAQTIPVERPSPLILVDAVFFQLYQTGIARVWRSLLEEWSRTEFVNHIIVLDRAGTAPKIPGIKYRTVPAYDYNNTDADRTMLQQVCDEEGADLLISTYYTTPISTPSVFMGYDMIPEVLGGDLNHPMWQEKHRAIQHATSYITISENTARDLIKFFPDISSDLVTVALCGVQSQFFPAPSEQINQFKFKYGISKPYFLLVGTGGYKNTELFLQAFAQLYSKQSFEIVCTGSPALLSDNQWRSYTAGSIAHILQLSEEELRTAYSGAITLVYPSKYEGFGLPVLEALACGCPVITCPNASIPEVAGEAALYVKSNDVDGLANALCDVQKPSVRKSLIASGLEQAKKFSWSKMAETVSSALINATLLHLNFKEINLIIFPNWSQDEETLGLELQEVISAIATHPDKNYITLLINIGNISEEDANLILSSVAMNLLMQEDLDVTEGPEISLVGQLSKIQWEVLLSRINARIVLENENQEAISTIQLQKLLLSNLSNLETFVTYSK